MITNERQYGITRNKAERLARAIKEFEKKGHGHVDVHPRLVQAERDGLASQLADLKDELKEYERLKTGMTAIRVGSFDELADGLIKVRIAEGLSQRALAQRLELKEQQVQRYEAERYASASFQRLCDVARALEIRSKTTLSIQKSGSASRRSQVAAGEVVVSRKSAVGGEVDVSLKSAVAGEDMVIEERVIVVAGKGNRNQAHKSVPGKAKELEG